MDHEKSFAGSELSFSNVDHGTTPLMRDSHPHDSDWPAVGASQSGALGLSL